ncbi:MAG TPA: hypothetical protein VK844_08315 [Hyphomicrobiales bacterium]|nr:hypothetical protein [Hyphomicrobiales bacterium]
MQPGSGSSSMETASLAAAPAEGDVNDHYNTKFGDDLKNSYHNRSPFRADQHFLGAAQSKI